MMKRIIIDLDRKLYISDDVIMEIPAKMYGRIRILITNSGRIIRNEILAQAEYDYLSDTKDPVANIRKRIAEIIKKFPDLKGHIQNVPGKGYYWNAQCSDHEMIIILNGVPYIITDIENTDFSPKEISEKTFIGLATNMSRNITRTDQSSINSTLHAHGDDYCILEKIVHNLGFKLERGIQKRVGVIEYECNHRSRIVKLGLTSCNLKDETIPEEIFTFPNLEVLILSQNMISSFPKNVTGLTKLKKLDLSNNQIRVLPKYIDFLTSLQYLDLSDNLLNTLPSSIGDLQNLVSIRVIDNSIMHLPEINPKKQWLSLEDLEIDGAYIDTLPSWIYSLKELRILSLSKLHLNHFPDKLYKLKKLNYLLLDSTEFPEWPEDIKLPKSLKHLVLDGSHLPFYHNSNIRKIPSFIVKRKPNYVRSQEYMKKAFSNLQVSLGGDILNGYNLDKILNATPEIAYKYLKRFELEEPVQLFNRQDRTTNQKLVVLGDGNVGKSSLVQRLCLDNPDNDYIPLDPLDYTHGININHHMHLSHIWDKSYQVFRDFTCTFWDFGGQDKYKSCNHLMLTDY